VIHRYIYGSGKGGIPMGVEFSITAKGLRPCYALVTRKDDVAKKAYTPTALCRG